MHRRASTMIGKPVMSTHRREHFDTVKALLLDHTAHRLLAFVVNRGGWTGSARVLLWQDARIQGDAVIATSDDPPIHSAADTPHIAQLLHAHPVFPTLDPVDIKTSDQQVFGRLNDLYFDPETGAIHAYEILQGLPVVGDYITQPAQGLLLTYRRGVLIIRQPPTTSGEQGNTGKSPRC